MHIKRWLMSFVLAAAFMAPLKTAHAAPVYYDYYDYDDYYYYDYYDDDLYYDDYGWEYEWWDGWEYETPYGEWEYEETWGNGYWEFEDDWWQ